MAGRHDEAPASQPTQSELVASPKYPGPASSNAGSGGKGPGCCLLTNGGNGVDKMAGSCDTRGLLSALFPPCLRHKVWRHAALLHVNPSQAVSYKKSI